MELFTEVDRATVWERLTGLIDGPSGAQFRVCGRITQHQFVMTVFRRRFSIPWRATFRGTVLTTKNGTLMTGKYDSNWSLYFLGYPVLLAVFANVFLNVLAGRADGRVTEFTLFGAGATAFCAILALLHQRDQRRLDATLHAVMTVPRRAV